MASRRVGEKVNRIKELILELQTEFEDKFDNSSEAWQESERGEVCMENISACQNAIDALDEIE